jgi:hypothetical protein
LSNIKRVFVFKAIRGKTITPSGSYDFEQGSWTTTPNGISYTVNTFGYAEMQGTYDRFDLEMDIIMDASATRAGILLD